MITAKEHVWTSALGEKTPFSELPHQHLSNILWHREAWALNWCKLDSVQIELLRELGRRFDGKRLGWKPLPIPEELYYLANRTPGIKIYGNGDIVHNSFGVCRIIGSVAHIENFRELCWPIHTRKEPE